MESRRRRNSGRLLLETSCWDGTKKQRKGDILGHNVMGDGSLDLGLVSWRWESDLLRIETTNPTTKTRYELQLKGAGITPYSRFADGKAVLRSSIREFIVSEALYALGIPTTRALSLTLLPHSKVRRETVEPGAIVARFAQTWLRIGTFDILRARGERELIRKLSTYITETSSTAGLPSARNPADDDIHRSYRDRNREGYHRRPSRARREPVHPAISRDRAPQRQNRSRMAGLCLHQRRAEHRQHVHLRTLDRLRPFRLPRQLRPELTPNHDDHMLRYSYRNQPTIIWWNLVRLGESLGELMGIGADVDTEEFVEKGVRQENADELVSGPRR